MPRADDLADQRIGVDTAQAPDKDRLDLEMRGEGEARADHNGVGIAAGAFVGWAFGLTDRLDLRIGIGAQYIYLDAPPLGASTPFVALDLVVGYRL